jgi:hypothetical protein
LDAVFTATTVLTIAEGEKKAIAAAQLGLAVVGIAGIHGWHPRGSRTLLADFDDIPLRGRRVDIVPDGDVRVNRMVETGAAELAAALEHRGARVKIVILPFAAAAA